jgi:glycosyltransferase involved in cell wall biosynthesis
MAMGKPILMTHSGCLDIDVEELGVGYKIAPDSPEAWEEAILSLQGNSSKAQEMGTRSLEATKNKFSQKEFGSALNQFIQTL